VYLLEPVRKKAVLLLSGGLDSLLAGRILLDQGIDVVGLHLYTGLCITEHKRRTGQLDSRGRVPQNPAFAAADTLGIPLEILDISDTYLDVIARPKYGRGSGVNPCKDCRIHMFERAEGFRRDIGADFIATGEVVGQRPMSQVRANLTFIHQRSGIEDIILMPLSAKLLPPTLPEREGWVDRERLYDLSGRGRKRQFEMARAYGISEWEQPAGGCCFLTDESFARKFRDLFMFDPDRRLDLEDIVLLGVGRHFRVSAHTKVVIGRYAEENAVIERHAGGGILLTTPQVPGPTAVVLGRPDDRELQACARIVARYSDGRDQAPVRVSWRRGDSHGYMDVLPTPHEFLESLRI
jgi:tRNA U34 2-thiouridine synthase MnmA/TrmU